MPGLTAATWACAALLVLAGVRKATSPGATGAALQVARLPSDPRLVRALGVAETTLGMWVLVRGGTAATLLLAACYAAFAGFAEHQRRQGAGCGCFGADDAPATAVHVGLDAAAAVVVTATALLAPTPALPEAVARAPLTGALTVALLAIAAGVLRLLLSDASDLAAALARLRPEREA